MSTAPISSRKRLDLLNPIVDRLETAFSTDFADWKLKGHTSREQYFARAYSETIDVTHSIGEEELERNKPDRYLQDAFDALFRRAVTLLRLADKYVGMTAEKAKERTEGLRGAHKMLLDDWVRLSRRSNIRGSNGTNGIGSHLASMAIGLIDHEPPIREVWLEDGSDLKSDPDFDIAYEEFLALDDRIPRNRQGQIELYARMSWIQLNHALRALHIPEHLAEPDDGFFNSNIRPTYVDYPCDSAEFLNGRGEHPGVLGLKEMLGGPLTAAESESVKRWRKKRPTTTNILMNIKRHRSDPTSSKNDMARYKSYNRLNAAADLEDVLVEGTYLVSNKTSKRENNQDLMHPTYPNRPEILATYEPAFCALVNEHFKTKFGLPDINHSLPKTSSSRRDWLTNAESEIRFARTLIRQKMAGINSAPVAKEVRIAAYRLKLARALFMYGLFSGGNPPASTSIIKTALRDRLSDWVLHEEAWNASDDNLLSRSGLKKETYNAVRESVKKREINIQNWSKWQDADTDDDVDVGVEMPLMMTKDEIDTAESLLMDVLHPRLPDRGDYLLDKRSERRRREWFGKMAVAKLTGEPIPEWTHKKVVDPFAAGGPPGFEKLPRNTVWERLLYMWVLTFWRLYQLGHLEW
ncbi:hypothetical protein GGS20DRAFT_586515 [Poronia punctata]|nr:hypothetical protein GGS20DRAFT_586515 [Poronia punctata]